jgi:long-chain acyl-CoA synthetase
VSKALTDAFEKLKKGYKKDVVTKPTVFYLSLGDAPDQKWTMTLSPQDVTFAQGKTEGPEVVLLKTAEDLFVKLINGQWVPGAMDFMRGKIKTNNIDGLKLLKDAFA